MTQRFAVLVFLAALAFGQTIASAQVTLLPPQEAVPVPASIVSNANNHLNQLYQKGWVALDSNGHIHGHYVQLSNDGTERPVGQVNLYITRNRVPVATVRTSEDGHFSFSGLPTGTYALVGRSQQSIAAFALHVLPNSAATRLGSEFTVYGTSMYGPVLEEVLRSHSVPGVQHQYPSFENDPVGEARRYNSAKVQLRPGNVLAGRISRASGLASYDLSGNVVHVLRNGTLVGHAATNERGEYEVVGVTPGVYDLIVVGKDGMAAGSFQAVAATGLSSNLKATTRFVSVQDGPGDSLNVELIPTDDYYVIQPEDVPPGDDAGFVPFPGGGLVGPGGFPGGGGGGVGGGGGGFGGGGGGGGLGGRFGIGGLLGIGGLAAGIAALAANDDGFNTPPASIIIP